MSGGRRFRNEASARWFGNSATLTQIYIRFALHT
jgi:hypothetical protein